MKEKIEKQDVKVIVSEPTEKGSKFSKVIHPDFMAGGPALRFPVSLPKVKQEKWRYDCGHEYWFYSDGKLGNGAKEGCPKCDLHQGGKTMRKLATGDVRDREKVGERMVEHPWSDNYIIFADNPNRGDKIRIFHRYADIEIITELEGVKG